MSGPSSPVGVYGLWSVTFKDRVTKLPLAIIKVAAEFTCPFEADMEDYVGGGSKFVLASEPKYIKADAAFQIKQFNKESYMYLGAGVDAAGSAEPLGAVVAPVNAHGTSAVAATGIASIAVKTGSEKDLKTGDYTGVVTAATTMQVLAQVGTRLPTWVEWLAAVTMNPGSATPASQNGNTNSGASSDDATQTCTADPTQAGRCLTGTGPSTSSWTGAAAGSSWYSPSGLADAVGNVSEWVATFFGGLQPITPGGGVAWGYQGDTAYNFYGQSYNPATGGYTAGLPALLFVGGGWSYGSGAGVRFAGAHISAGDADINFGFRPAR